MRAGARRTGGPAPSPVTPAAASCATIEVTGPWYGGWAARGPADGVASSQHRASGDALDTVADHGFAAHRLEEVGHAHEVVASSPTLWLACL
ncbi:hypothetical protein DSI35_23980 [Mycobacterium tuberculosis]|uniref:Uncharacterized protein n=4 Tax=Mycobacterium tuberculosis complex TaxID=77643 RepID=A0AB73YKI2_MYCTX|nr:hypothetical protein Mb1595_p3039 [Mycobacterium tuberculosis variant bovis]APR58060.1 hypothetical protein BTU11_15005 [Mycobacterium tuberculosis]AYP12961.1 hypothetical protein EBQ37_15160 [Mycobacterium tuberculosis variant bovis BCG]ORT88601.1 hypothetical protein BS299_11705 [Mycobacterium tuberculosis M13]PRH92055.1 hypothetical protein B8A26_08820 [Mycobacterium tuberculosis variant pinnipedii]PRH96360.1 hypothetical protein B8A28_11940 [Mycobacterium tuberculosis variant caprae]PR